MAFLRIPVPGLGDSPLLLLLLLLIFFEKHASLPGGEGHPRLHGAPPPPDVIIAGGEGCGPVAADRGWFELVRCHGDAAGPINTGAAALARHCQAERRQRRQQQQPASCAAAGAGDLGRLLPFLVLQEPALSRPQEPGRWVRGWETGRQAGRRRALESRRLPRRGEGAAATAEGRSAAAARDKLIATSYNDCLGILFQDHPFLESSLGVQLEENILQNCIFLDPVQWFVALKATSVVVSRKKILRKMNGFSSEESNFTFLDEGFAAKDIVDQKINEVSSSDDKDAFYIADLGDILKKHLRWYKALPRVSPFYAVKCNDSIAVVKTLAALGAGFDCASKTEIQLVQSVGVPPERIIYANPCKQVSQIKHAANNGVQMMTFDSEVELMKVARAHPKSKLVLRIATDDSKAVCRLSVKFGATLKTSRLLLERAKELDIDVIGVSFHVGSGCTDPETFVQAISDARCVFDMGAELGFSMHLLDIGGGFPGSEDVKLKFEEITNVINPALDKYFPSDSGVRIIAEPGRYYVASAFTLAVNIIAKKVVIKEQTGSDDEEERNDKTLMYYVNDGVYGSFNCILYDHAHVKPVLQKRPKPDERYYSCSIWGPTCDGLDRIVERCGMPELQVGDWMLFENMGAYTVAAASTFNGFQRPTIHYVMSRPAWQLMEQIKEQGFQAEVEEQDVTLPLSCAWESGIEHHPATCASASINV